MPFRPVTLPAAVPGSLWLSSMPGRTLDWPDFLAEAHARDLGLVVCLTPVDEMEELSPTYAKAVKHMGPSGSGKSTLLHLLGLLDEPTSGSYHFNGKNISAFS